MPYTFSPMLDTCRSRKAGFNRQQYVLPILSVLVTAAPFVAHAQGAPAAGTWYELVNQNSGSCIDDNAWGTADGTPVQQWACGSQQANQQWQLQPADSGYYSLVSRNAPDKVIDVEDQSIADGSHVHLWQYLGNSNQQWMPVALGNGYYKFVGRGSGRCLDTPAASKANGVQLQIWNCNGTGAQAFLLMDASGAAATSPAAFYVSPSGNDGGAGSQQDPFATLDRARAAMESNSIHTTYLEAGMYALASPVTLSSVDSGFSFLAEPGQVPVLDGRGNLSTLLALNGASGVTITGLQMQNTAGAGGSAPNTAALMLQGASGNTIAGNHFVNAGSDAVLLIGSSGNTVSGNEIDSSAQNAIEDKDGGSKNIFDSNLINGVSALETTGGGFYLHGTDQDVISHNLVENTQGIGIGVEAIGGYNGGTLYARNTGTLITQNIVRNTNLGSSDSGAIYTIDRTGQDTATQITNNLVDGARNANNSNAHLVGLYFDDYSSGITAAGNIIRGVATHGVQFHGGRNISVQGNIIDTSGYNGASGSISAVLFQGPPTDIVPNSGAQPATNDVFSSNILFSTQSAPQDYVSIDYPTPASITGNLYWDSNQQWKGTGDANPQFGNPEFADPANDNYSLGTGSAAGSIGFQQIDQSAIGLHPSGPHWY